MIISAKKKNEAFDILKDYEGENPYILTLKKEVYVNKNIDAIGNFQAEYILKNNNTSPKPINKIVKLADWYAEAKKKEWELDFLPNKIKIVTLLGETESTYNCYIQYRQSVPPQPCFLRKNGLLTNFLVEDYRKIEVDFDRYSRLSDFKRILFDHQKDAVKFLLSRKKCILADDMGLGKMEPLSSLIPTPDGFRKMGDIKVGDYVFSEDGKPTKVVKTFDHKEKEIYKITFSDGTTCRCGLEHLWKVETPVHHTKKQGYEVLSLGEMLKRGLQYKNSNRNKYRIPTTAPVEYSTKNFFIDPYILGICIGDGNMCSSSGINISIPDFEKETVYRIQNILRENYVLSINRNASCPRYRIKSTRTDRHNEYFSEIKRLGLNVHGNEKFIPDEYKLGSVEQRLSLLRGLMDSDGSIRHGNKIVYYTNSKRLAEDVAELVFSLGGIARIRSYCREKNGKKHVEYHIAIQIKENPFLLSRKSQKYNPTFKKYCSKYITSIEKDGIEDAKCLMVESNEHTYLTSKSYIVTHNTTAVSVAAIEGNFDSVLIICPASIKEVWKRELSYYIPEKDITIIEGFSDKKKGELEVFLGYAEGKSNMTREQLLEEAKEHGQWKFNRFIIVNYDIVDNFFKSKRTYTKEQFDELLENNPMLKYINNRKSLIILDEAHNLSNSKSIRYKTIRGLIIKGKPDSIYAVTGTPITNDPANLYCVLNLLGDSITSDWDYYMKRYCAAEEFCKDKEERNRWTQKFLEFKKKSTWYDLTKEEKDELKKYLHEHCKFILIPKGSSNLEELRDRISHIYLRRTKDSLTLPEKTIHEMYYDLTPSQEDEYNRLWEEYEEEKKTLDPEKEINKDLLEGAIYRQYLSNEMIPNTIALTDRAIAKGEKVVIACCYDEELYKLQEHYKDKCVIYNGKLSLRQKEDAISRFTDDDNVMVFIGNIKASSVGITLIASRTLIFNTFSYSDIDNKQMSDRVHRLGQKKPCHIIYQVFKNTYNEHALEICLKKENIFNTVIKKECEKK